MAITGIRGTMTQVVNISNTRSDVSALMRHSATARFKEASKPVEEVAQELDLEETKQKELALNVRARYSQEIDKIKEFAKSIGEDLTDEDICYALKYGRSVLADYSA